MIRRLEDLHLSPTRRKPNTAALEPDPRIGSSR